jgi:hypothetical protein
MLGAGRAYQPSIFAAKVLAMLALMGCGHEPSPEEATGAARRARLVATELALPDPVTQLPAAAISLARSGRCSDPEAVINAVHPTGSRSARPTAPA